MPRITAEQIERINEVYAQCGMKSKTAKIVGVSVASVNKYLNPNYVPKEQRIVEAFDEDVHGSDSFIEELLQTEDTIEKFFESFCLSEKEWVELKELQKEIYL